MSMGHKHVHADAHSGHVLVRERGQEGVWGNGRRGGREWEHVWLGVIWRMRMPHPCLYVSMCERD
jgi:hypothetical protein